MPLLSGTATFGRFEMAQREIEHALATVIDAESQVGIRWWPRSDMAPVALRRWSSFTRRHPKVKNPATEMRVLDLAKGLQAHFERDIPYTPLSEWLHLAGTLSTVLARKS